MAHSILAYLALFLLIANLCHCFNPKLLNDQYGSDWLTTNATWYGAANGLGSTGGSCGYKEDVGTAPFSSKITAVGPSLYDSGRGCGTCYQVKCTWSEHCSESPVTVVVTDSCKGCEDAYNHKFDLSGTSYGAMAKSGEETLLRNVGSMEIQYKRVECDFVGTSVAFKTDSGSNPSYFAMTVEYENGDELSKVEIRQANMTQEDAWKEMQVSWGAVYKADFPMAYPAPYSIRLTESSKYPIVAENVIPGNYVPGETCRSIVNFPEL